MDVCQREPVWCISDRYRRNGLFMWFWDVTLLMEYHLIAVGNSIFEKETKIRDKKVRMKNTYSGYHVNKFRRWFRRLTDRGEKWKWKWLNQSREFRKGHPITRGDPCIQQWSIHLQGGPLEEDACGGRNSAMKNENGWISHVYSLEKHPITRGDSCIQQWSIHLQGGPLYSAMMHPFTRGDPCIQQWCIHLQGGTLVFTNDPSIYKGGPL